MRIRNLNDCIMGTALFALSALLFHETFHFREIFSFSFGPRVFPRIILGVTGLCSLVLMVQSVDFKGGARKAPGKSAAGVSVMVMRCGMVALLAAYIAILPVLGYLPATIGFLFLLMLLLGVRTPRSFATYAVVAVVTACSLKYVFGTLLKFFLP